MDHQLIVRNSGSTEGASSASFTQPKTVFGGFQRGVWQGGGNISIIGVVHTPVAKFTFALFMWELLVESKINSEIWPGI